MPTMWALRDPVAGLNPILPVAALACGSRVGLHGAEVRAASPGHLLARALRLDRAHDVQALGSEHLRRFAAWRRRRDRRAGAGCACVAVGAARGGGRSIACHRSRRRRGRTGRTCSSSARCRWRSVSRSWRGSRSGTGPPGRHARRRRRARRRRCHSRRRPESEARRRRGREAGADASADADADASASATRAAIREAMAFVVKNADFLGLSPADVPALDVAAAPAKTPVYGSMGRHLRRAHSDARLRGLRGRGVHDRPRRLHR